MVPISHTYAAVKGWFSILCFLIASTASYGEESMTRVSHFCRLLEQDRQYLEENLETVLRGELASEEISRLAPLASNEQCEESFAFEVEKAEFLLIGLKTIPEGESNVARSEISFGTPVVNQMQRENEIVKADSLILLEMVSSLPAVPSERVVEMKFNADPSNSALRKDFPVLWKDLVSALKQKIKNLNRSFKLSVISTAP